MIDKAKIFNQAIARLADVYKDSPAQMEAMNAAAGVCAALMEDTAFDTDIKTKPKTGSEMKERPQDVKPGTAISTDTAKSPKINQRSVKGAETTLVKAAKIDPVQIKHWSDTDLDGAIRDGAIERYKNSVSDEDPMKMLQDEADGTREKEVALLKEKIAKDEEKRKKKEGEQFAKTKKKLDTQTRKTNDYARRQAEVDEKIASNKEMQDQMAKMAEEFDAEGNPKAAEFVRKNMKPGLMEKLSGMKDSVKSKFLGFLKKKSAAAQEKLQDAADKLDPEGVAEAVEELNDLKVICEAVGIDVDSILG